MAVYQLVLRADPTVLVAEADTEAGIHLAELTIGAEMRCLPGHHLQILHPPDAVYPTLGHGDMTAREMGLPLSEEFTS